MTSVSRTKMLSLALMVSAIGLAATATQSRLAQITSGNTTIMDNGDAGFSAPGFNTSTHQSAYGGDAAWYKRPIILQPGMTGGIATWTFTSLAAGTYKVYATWLPTAMFTQNAVYIAAGNGAAVQKTVSQRIAPTMTTDGKWETIGTVSVSANGTLTVTVQNAGGADYVQADAVKIVQTSTSGGTPQPSVCGNNIVEPGEACETSMQFCTSQCTYMACGDGITTWPERCDDGNFVNGDGCAADCSLCKNGTVDPGEQCDDGNNVDSDTCTNACVSRTFNVCGNAIKEGAEECDDGNTSNHDNCSTSCKNTFCGDTIIQVSRHEQCDDGNTVNTDGCTNNCKTQVCGNYLIEPPEQCDNGAQNGFGPCRNNCTLFGYDICGNGIVQGMEECDDSNTIATDACTDLCKNARCGDGIVRANVEQCDDGNTVNTDACNNSCQSQTITIGCGNGTVEPGEVCDNGSMNGPSPLQCSTSCRWTMINVCGNGLKEGTEQCDDGNTVNTDGCTNNCRTGGVCGNAVEDPGEECDDGNTVNNDSCTAQCKDAYCGDWITLAGQEQCDDGNTANGDGCSSTCQVQSVAPTCGNGSRQGAEECDDGNQSNTDGCTNACKLPTCRDGYVQGTEQCDDGNNVDTDSCKNNCTNNATTGTQGSALCGNWIFNPGEQCDMGGVRTPIPNNATQCCTASCQVETCGTAASPAASLTIRTLAGAQTRGIVQHGQETAIRFTATTGAQAVTITQLRFKTLQGNFANGFSLVQLVEDANDDGIADSNWYAQGTVQNGKATFAAPVTIPANTAKTLALFVSASDYTLATPNVIYHPQGPLQVDFDTGTADYVRASHVGSMTQLATELAYISTNGSCAQASCAIAVTTAPTVTLNYLAAGNLDITGTAPAAMQLNAGTESPTLLRLTMRPTDHEDVQMYVLPFTVQGQTAVSSLSVYVNGVQKESAIAHTRCGGLDPDIYGMSTNTYPNPGNQYCAIFDSETLLTSGTDAIVEIRANIRPANQQWTSGTKVRISVIQAADYLYALGWNSGVSMSPNASAAQGGKVTYLGTLVTPEHTAVKP